MGDMADVLIDQMFDDPFCEQEDDDGPAGWTIKCRCCGVEGLVWGRSNGKWRLHDYAANLHICSVNPLKEVVATSTPSYNGAEFAPLPAGHKMSEHRKKNS